MAAAWLILDSINRRVGVAAGFGQTPAWQSLGERDKAYVSVVDQVLKQANVRVSDIASVVVVQGTGGFSDTRAAVLFAGTLRWQNKNIKLFEIAVEAGSPAPVMETGEQIAALVKQVGELKPRYFAEPNITKPSK